MRFDLRLPEQSDWIKVFDPRDGTLRLAKPAAASIAVGDLVRVDLSIGAEGPRVTVRGDVVAVRGEGSDGYVLVALAHTEREKINYLNGYVRGGMLNLRTHRRLPIRLKVTFGGISGPVETICKDINDEGIFVITEAPLPETSQIHMLIAVPGRDDVLSLLGTVSHTVVPADEDVPGMGIVFVFEGKQQADLRAVLDELELALAAGTLPSPAMA